MVRICMGDDLGEERVEGKAAAEKLVGERFVLEAGTRRSSRLAQSGQSAKRQRAPPPPPPQLHPIDRTAEA